MTIRVHPWFKFPSSPPLLPLLTSVQFPPPSSAARLSGSAINSFVCPSGRHASRPSSSTRTITPRKVPRSVFTRSPAPNSAVRLQLDMIAAIESWSSTPVMKCAAADATSLRRMNGKSLNSAFARARPISANVLPLKKRKGARLWHDLRNSKASSSVNSRERTSSHSLATASLVSLPTPCCAPPRAQSPRLIWLTDAQFQFCRKLARLCNGAGSPPPPPECPRRLTPSVGLSAVSSLIILTPTVSFRKPTSRFRKRLNHGFHRWARLNSMTVVPKNPCNPVIRGSNSPPLSPHRCNPCLNSLKIGCGSAPLCAGAFPPILL